MHNKFVTSRTEDLWLKTKIEWPKYKSKISLNYADENTLLLKKFKIEQ